MMGDGLVRKLTSRKLWFALGTVIALLLQDTRWAEVAAAAVTAAYVIAEALLDAVRTVARTEEGGRTGK